MPVSVEQMGNSNTTPSTWNVRFGRLFSLESLTRTKMPTGMVMAARLSATQKVHSNDSSVNWNKKAFAMERTSVTNISERLFVFELAMGVEEEKEKAANAEQSTRSVKRVR